MTDDTLLDKMLIGATFLDLAKFEKYMAYQIIG